jgi:hypothetical protein
MARKRSATDVVNLKIRFTEAMRARIEQEAKKNQRSLNGEIVYRLAATFGVEGIGLVDQYEEVEEELARRLREVVQSITAEQIAEWQEKRRKKEGR